jgi:phosphoribosyl 1,2-cyclic phosphate phosphodiesterase
MSLKITIMGCGHSAGTPAIGNYWGNCDPDEPKNYRTRASVLVQSDTTNLVIDTGPDIRNQVNKTGINKIDAVLYTHAHSDHIVGIDELRTFRLKDKKITDIYGDIKTINELKKRFDYLFVTKHSVYPRSLNDNIINEEQFNKPMKLGDIEFIPYPQDHGKSLSLGYRFGDVAYSTDFVDLPDEAINTLKGVKIWIADGCGYKMENNIVHANLNKLYKLNEQIGAQKVIIHHLSPLMDYKTLCKELPEGFEPGYDGYKININTFLVLVS